MRENNFCFPTQNRACLTITSALYDRRALDCTSALPLINSLTHLAYLTSTSPRIREILTQDGGIERLVRILELCGKQPSAEHIPTAREEKQITIQWSLAFQCVVNIGVRGSEQIRTRVVDAGMVSIVASILAKVLGSIEEMKLRKEQKAQAQVSPVVAVHLPSTMSDANFSQLSSNVALSYEAEEQPAQQTPSPSPAKVYRDDDVLLCLQLLAYLSKYPRLRLRLHNLQLPSDRNLFSIVEQFSHRSHSLPVRYWSGVVMRNACRKDDTQGGVRQCAHMRCGRWERYPREFAKCRRCRKAKYCSKLCQSRAWSEGHRWWCVERTHSENSGERHAAAETMQVEPSAEPEAPSHVPNLEQRMVVTTAGDRDSSYNDELRLPRQESFDDALPEPRPLPQPATFPNLQFNAPRQTELDLSFPDMSDFTNPAFRSYRADVQTNRPSQQTTNCPSSGSSPAATSPRQSSRASAIQHRVQGSMAMEDDIPTPSGGEDIYATLSDDDVRCMNAFASRTNQGRNASGLMVKECRDAVSNEQNGERSQPREEHMDVDM